MGLRMRIKAIFSALMITFSVNAVAHAITSSASGAWSNGATWVGGVVPSTTDIVIIAGGNTVTVDISTAIASTTTINGTLTFSTVVGSTLTIAGGNITVNSGGSLIMGSTTTPPSSAISMNLYLAAGTTAAEYGLIIQNGGNFLAGGASNRNVLIQSSGTFLTNGAYIQSYSQSPTGFIAVNANFAGLGGNVNRQEGIVFNGNGTTGEISSCTIHDGYKGVNLAYSSGTVISYNTFTNASDESLDLAGADNTQVIGNDISGQGLGIDFNSGAANNTILQNKLHNNAGNGIGLGNAFGTLVVGNWIYNNTSWGVDAEGESNNTFINNYVYGNGSYGIYLSASSGDSWIGGALGYDGSLNATPDASQEIAFDETAVSNFLVRGAQVNPSAGNILYGGFGQPNSYLIYETTIPGRVEYYGDYALSGSTLTLDYASELYTSTATTPVDLSNHGNSATVTATNDVFAVSQLITLTNTGGTTWSVWGSSSGNMGSFSGSQGAQNIPTAGNTQCVINFTQSASHTAGDVVTFGLMAASNDFNVQKKMYIGESKFTFNNGRSKIRIASTGHLHAVGTTNAPTLIDSLPGAGTYYAFVDSGSLVLQYANVMDTDEQRTLAFRLRFLQHQ